ncbi:MAG: cyclophilin-like fold protein [Candidatus Bipolaricaulota bacterium]
MEIVLETEATGPVQVRLDERAPETVKALWAALPISSEARRWGQEVYFSTPVQMGPEAAVETVEAGEVAYWPEGHALCVFFGPTPASRHADELRPASPVNPVGRVAGDPSVFDKVREGDEITIRAV